MSTIPFLLHPDEDILVEARIALYPFMRGFYLLFLYALVCGGLVGMILLKTSGLTFTHFQKYYDFWNGFGQLTPYIKGSYPSLSLAMGALEFMTMGPVLAVLLLACIGIMARGIILRLKTELVVTNLRVIAKFGWLARDVAELHHQSVQDLTLSQPVLGRIFDYGTIDIRGYAGVIARVHFVSDPFYFRAEALEEMERAIHNASAKEEHS